MAGYKTWALNEGLSAADLNEYIAKQIVPYFSTNSARDLGIPSPAGGQIAYSAEYSELYKFNAVTGTWVSQMARTVWKDTDTARTTTTFIDDPDLHLLLEANSLYVFEGTLIYTADVASDIKIRSAYTGTMANEYWTVTYLDVSQTSGANVPLSMDALSMPGTPIIAGGGASNVLCTLFTGKLITTTAGTWKVQSACNVAGNAALGTGSFLRFWKAQ